MKFLLFVFALFIIAYFWTNKIVFRFDTLFRKGFKRIKDTYGVYCWIGKQGDGKTISVIDWVLELSLIHI